MKSLLILSLLFFPFAAPTFGANISVPSLELYTKGAVQNGSFGFESRGEMDLLVEGGYKFGGRIVLRFDSSTNLEKASLDTFPIESGLAFKSASITLRDLFGLPLAFTYFIGEGDTFCSGDLFPQVFGSLPLATSYRGFLHFPEGTIYDGIHLINGTGLQLDFNSNPEKFFLSFYLYQDSMVDADGEPETLNPGYYSADVRSAFNFEKIKLEAFLGGTFPTPDSAIGYYRGGLLFYAQDVGVEFLAQLGITRWAPLDDPIGIELFYLLFEPRIRLGLLSIIPTFFWRPAYYHQQSTGDQALDVNINFQIGDPGRTPVSGGIESNLAYRISQNEINIKVSPYLQFSTSGVVWEIRVNTNLWPYDRTSLIEAFLAVKAEF